MDTDFDVDWNKCKRCYTCIKLCSDTYKQYGWLGHLIVDEYDGTPEYNGDNPSCHHCEAIVDGELTNYACNKICPEGAIKITRW